MNGWMDGEIEVAVGKDEGENDVVVVEEDEEEEEERGKEIYYINMCR